MTEVAAREHAQGRKTVVWSDDKFFASPQALRKAPGVQPTTSAETLDRAFQKGAIQAAKFLQSEPFDASVAKAYGIPDARPLIAGTYRGLATDWLYHPTNGPWADASARFAELTKGEVRAVVSGAAPDRVFGAVELPRQTFAKVVPAQSVIPYH